ncbi:hypothetical protein Misp06_03808 [Microbulbifer sp. NBRC 101763]|uniref:hypothetical protein n=1 Tax=Microbulbifer sp. NBRC 101763 TaxID=1113820 RepID=UPI0030ABD6A6
MKKEKEPDSKYRHRRENAVWKWSTEKLLDSTENSIHIDKLIEIFKSKASELQKLRDMGCRTEIWNYWDSTGQGGPSLYVKTMKDLVELGLDIVWDIYFDDGSG